MFAHTEDELQSRPDLKCTSLCPILARGGVCSDADCQFAHDKAELRVTNVFYKTGLCKDFQRGECLLGDTCRHAHVRDELQHTRTRSKEANSRRSSRSSVRSSNAENSQAEDTDHLGDNNSRRGSITSEQGDNFDVEAKPNGPAKVNVGGLGALLSQMSSQPKRRVTAPAKLQKQLKDHLKFGGNEYISDDESTGTSESDQATPEVENSPQSNPVNNALLDLYNQYKANEEFAQSQFQNLHKPVQKKPATFGAAWAAGNATKNAAQRKPQQVPNVQAQGGYPNNIQASQSQSFIPTFYMPYSGQIPAALTMSFGPNSNLDSSERHEIAEQLLQAQPEYYDD